MSGMRGWWAVSAGVAIMVLPSLAGPVSASSYTWTLMCRVGGDFPGGARASWDWLQDGQVIGGAGGTGYCGEGGSGDRPANADGVTVSLLAQAYVPGLGGGFKIVTRDVTKSFDPADGFQLTLHASASIAAKVCSFGDLVTSCDVQHSSVHARFTMTG